MKKAKQEKLKNIFNLFGFIFTPLYIPSIYNQKEFTFIWLFFKLRYTPIKKWNINIVFGQHCDYGLMLRIVIHNTYLDFTLPLSNVVKILFVERVFKRNIKVIDGWKYLT